MYRELIGERDDSQVAPAKLRSGCPEAESVVFPGLNTDRRSDDPNAHLFREIRALPQNLVLEIRREFGSPALVTFD